MIAPQRMSSGKYVDLARFTEEDVDLGDITVSLNRIRRFGGHSKDIEPLTVAQHTLLCINLSEVMFPGDRKTRFDCLLHDMPEAYYGDIPSPVKNIFGEAIRPWCEHIDTMVYNKLWKDSKYTKTDYWETKGRRKICDLMALDIERRNLWASQVGKENWPTIPFEDRFKMVDKRQMFADVQSVAFVDLPAIYEDA